MSGTDAALEDIDDVNQPEEHTREPAVIFMAAQEIDRLAKLVQERAQPPMTFEQAVEIVRLVVKEASIYE